MAEEKRNLMLLSPAADWLNTTFHDFDYAGLHMMHRMGEDTNYIATYFWKFITFFAEDGICMLLLMAALMAVGGIRMTTLRRKNLPVLMGPDGRYTTACQILRCGLTGLLGIAFGAIITNLTIKGIIARPRPYIDASGIYHTWWAQVGSVMDPEFSFPSGHTTCTMAAMTAIVLHGNRKVSWTAWIFVVLMGLSRMYLMMHYPSDILGGMLVGGTACLIAYALVSLGFCKVARQTLPAQTDTSQGRRQQTDSEEVSEDI